MNTKDTAKRFSPTPETMQTESAPEQISGDSTEARQKSAQEIMIDFLVAKKIISTNEIPLVSSKKLEDTIRRNAHEFEHYPDKLTQAQIEAMRRTLGLQPNFGEGIINKVERDREIKKIVAEMQSYLEKFKTKCPEVLGMIIFGSRMDPDKLPTPDSDVDVVLILKEGVNTDPSTKEGEALLYRLRAFSDSTPTASGFAVEIDEIYSTNELFSKLKNPTDKSMPIWGWNPSAIKYVGENLDESDENEVQIKLLKGLDHPDLVKFKQDTITKAKEAVVHYLGQTKKQE